MKQIKQCSKQKLLEILMAGVSTFAIILLIMLFTRTPAFAGTEFNINTTNVDTLQRRLSSVATVSGSAISVSESIITITLKNDINGMLLIEGQQGTTFVLDAAGHTINGAGHNEAVQLTNSNNATVILKGNGTYHPGINNTVYVGGWGKLIIQSGTFNAPTSGRIIRSGVYFELADGYDYFSVTTKDGDLFTSHNRKEKNSYSILSDAGQLVVSQCNGEVPSYNIETIATSNGNYDVTVNGIPATSAKVDDTVTVTLNPNSNYRFSRMTVMDDNPERIYYSTSGGSGDSRVFNMPDSNASIEVHFVWFNQITTQPTDDNPTVVTNNPDGVSSYQWYTTSVETFTMVDGLAGTGEVAANGVIYGNYDIISKTWSTNSELWLFYYSFGTGDRMIISDITGNITYCDGSLQADGSYIIEYPSSYIRVSFSDPGGSCKITLRRIVEIAVEGQTSDTYTGPRGNVYAKVNFTNGNVLNSNTITYEDISPEKYTVTVHNGSGNGNYEVGATVTITADTPEEGKQFKEWAIDSGRITLASSTSASTIFTMPAEAVVVTSTYEDMLPAKYVVTVNNGSGGGNYEAGTTVTITADTPKEGKRFKEWIVKSGGITLAGSTSASTTFIMPAEEVEVTSTYIDITISAPSPSWTPNLNNILEGKVEKTYQQDDDAPAVNVNNSSDELKARVLTLQENNMVTRGEDAKIVLKVTDISTTVSDEDKMLVEDKLAAENGAKDMYVLYVDLSLYKQIGSQAQTKVTKTNGKISISLEVPKELWNNDITKSREFYVLRIHDGEVSRIEGSFDSDKCLLTFETDRFSTYALTYKDTIRIHTYNDFHHLQLKAKAGKTSQTLSYNEAASADGYLIYGGKCGQEMIELADLPANTTSYTVKNLKKGTYYKYQVKAYRMIDGEQVFIMTSKVVHTITESKSYANPTRITTDTASVKLNAGESKTVTGLVVLPKDKKQKEHTSVIRYESSNKEIATVNSKGKITSKEKGSCYVYAYAQNGVYKKIKITVK